ncbi:glycosyltransferase family 2 protein [Mesorhizobium sp. M0293]|uniref:glycosyltransferase family 2 protein n=1 Tax=Mesorhizobium sp. M0293 TaxID=2956930 RepID=UPI00333545E5
MDFTGCRGAPVANRQLRSVIDLGFPLATKRELGLMNAITHAGSNKLSIVVPCYDEELGLQELYRRVIASTEGVSHRFELILVDDGSRDGTWQKIAELAARDDLVVGLKLSRNHGHALALSAGLARVSGDLILVLDADLQDPPEKLLAEMLAEMISQRADVIYGQRLAGETAFKRATAKLFYRLLSRVSEIDIPVDTGDFRLMTRRVVDALNAMPEHDCFVRGMIAWIGFQQIPFFYNREKRFAGTTNYPLKKMLKLAIDGAISFSMAPLRIAVFLSLALIIALIGVALFTLYSYLFLSTAPGWSSLVLVFVSVSAVQALALAAISEYVGRAYVQLKGRPLFVVAEIVGRRPNVRENADA